MINPLAVISTLLAVLSIGQVQAAWPWSDLADKVLDTSVCEIHIRSENRRMRNLNGHLVPDGFAYAPFVITKVSSDFLELYRRSDRARLIVEVHEKPDSYELVITTGKVYFTCYD